MFPGLVVNLSVSQGSWPACAQVQVLTLVSRRQDSKTVPVSTSVLVIGGCSGLPQMAATSVCIPRVSPSCLSF